MDNLTHSLVGLFLGRAGLRKSTPNGMGLMILAANAPDLDVISWFWGREEWLRWHRNFTHSLAGAPLMALVSVMIVRLAGRKPMRWFPAFFAALVAIASHIILDLTNTYGVRLLLPFSGRWFAWSLTPVVDFTIWALLLAGVAAPLLARLVSSEIGERRRTSGAGWAAFAVLLLFVYDYSRGIFHRRAVDLAGSRTWNGLAPRRAGAFPQANPLVWKGIAELSNAYIEIPIDLRAGFYPEDATTIYKSPRGPAALAAMATEPFERMLEFVQYPLWIVEPAPDPSSSGGATRITLMDLRFGSPALPGFSAVATVNGRNQVIDSFFTFGGSRPR